jgi:catechol-2,3-dioxygenase
MIGQLRNVVLDAADVAGLTAFYRDLTGWPVTYDADDWTALTVPDGRRLCVQPAPDHVPPRWPDPDYPTQLHVDLLVPDIEAAATRAVELGATRLGGIDRGQLAWITLADPAGHPFDLCRRSSARDGVSAPMGLFGPCLDTDDPATLARFYSALLSMSVTWAGEEGAAIESDRGAVFIQRVGRYVRPQWPDPAYPQQGHIDVDVADLASAEQEVLALGATRLPGGGDTYRVYADPSGHPFCLVVEA